MADLCPIGSFIDYITDSSNIWDKSKYVAGRTVSGFTLAGSEFSFRFIYLLGSAFMEGTFGKDAFRIELVYRDSIGFQIKRTMADGNVLEEAHPWHDSEKVKQIMLRYADTY